MFNIFLMLMHQVERIAADFSPYYSHWGERSEPLPSQPNVNFVCVYMYVYMYICMSWTGSILASKVGALYRVDCYIRVKLAS